MALTNLNKLFVRVTEAGLRDAVIAKSGTDNKIYFLTTTHEIITHGVVYGISSNVQDEITKIKSILNTYYTGGTKDSVKTAIDAVQTALDAYKTENDAKRALLVKAVAYNAANKTIDFTSEDGVVHSSIKASDIIGNHIVKSSAYDASTNKLTITFSAGDKANTGIPVDIDLSKLLDMNDVISGDVEHFVVSYAEKRLTIRPVTATVASDTVGLADAKDVKSYVDAAQGTLQASIDTINGKLNIIQGEETVEGSINKALKDAKEYADRLNSTTTDGIANEVSDRKAADVKLYGGDSIPETGAATISGNAAAIKEITDALANPSTFWEDYAPEAQP